MSVLLAMGFARVWENFTFKVLEKPDTSSFSNWVKCQEVNREWLRFIKTAPRYFGPSESCSSQNCPSMLRQPKMSSPKLYKFDSPMVPRHFCRSAQEEFTLAKKKTKKQKTFYSNITESPIFEGDKGSGT